MVDNICWEGEKGMVKRKMAKQCCGEKDDVE
jgi:hypothetical protein